jgi:exopolyphosphatase/guanosine-5'-triphosphate,3'-diphosphate pyrophosphatase
MQVGVVRHTERHLAHDPPAEGEIAELRRAVAGELGRSVPPEVRATVGTGVAVAGTATSCAAMDLELETYRTEAVEGHVLSVERLGEMLRRLAAVPLEERRRAVGLDPARAPTIVAGIAVLLEVLVAFQLPEVVVSDRDILWGVALEAAQ